MQIKDILLAPGNGGFFYDDQVAIGAGSPQDGFIYVGEPITPGFTSIRVPASSLSVGLVLADDTVFWGDMMGVQYSGAGGRDPSFEAAQISDLTSRAWRRGFSMLMHLAIYLPARRFSSHSNISDYRSRLSTASARPCFEPLPTSSGVRWQRSYALNLICRCRRAESRFTAKAATLVMSTWTK